MLSTNSNSKVRQYIDYAVPTVLCAWIFCCHSIISGIFIGRHVGEEGLAALNLSVPLLYIPYALSVMIGVGGSTLVARLLGERREKEAAIAFTEALQLLALTGLLFAIVIYIWAPTFVRWTGATGTLTVLAQDYLRAYAPFVIFSTTCYALELFLRVEGAARYGLYCLTFGALSDVALTWLMVVHFEWGMKGAALASGISQTISCVPMLAYHFVSARHVYPLKQAFATWRYSGKIAYNGLSEFLGEMAPSVTIFAFNYVVLRWLGEAGLVAFSVVEYMTMIASVTMVALVQSMQPMVSFYRGAGDHQSVREAFLIGTIVTTGFAVLSAVAMLLFAKPLVNLFVPGSLSAWNTLRSAIPWYALAFVPAALNLAIAGYLTAVEIPLESLIIVLLRSWIFLLGALWLLTHWLGGNGIWMAVMTTEIATLAVSILVFRMQAAKEVASLT
jgi:putative MATE family efflux protein